MITINNKEYEINTNIKMGTYKRYESDPSAKNTEKIVREILLPHPTEEEFDEMGLDDIGDIMLAFSKKQKQKDTEFKKKLSR